MLVEDRDILSNAYNYRLYCLKCEMGISKGYIVLSMNNNSLSSLCVSAFYPRATNSPSLQ